MSAVVADAAPVVDEKPWENLPPDFEKVLRSVAWRMAVGYGGYSDPKDLVQVAWLWIYEHPKQVRKWWYETPGGERKFGYQRARWDACRACQPTAKRDRLYGMGYDPADDFVYAAGIVKQWLPFVWHSDILAVLQEVSERGSNRVDPARGGNAAVLAMDVRGAYRVAIEPGSPLDEVLFGLYGGAVSRRDLAHQLGVSEVTVDNRHKRGIQVLVDHLNGNDEFELALGQRR